MTDLNTCAAAPRTITLGVQELCELLTIAARRGRECAPTAGEHTDSGIAYHVLADSGVGKSLGWARFSGEQSDASDPARGQS